MKTHRTWTSAMLVVAAGLLAVSCGGGGGGGPGGINGDSISPGKLSLIDISVADFDGVALNTIILFEFSEQLQPDSVRPDTIQIREGPNFAKQVFGDFRVDGANAYFYPDLPTKPDFGGQVGEVSYVGLKPGTTYQIKLNGAPKVAVVRNYMDDPLQKSYTERFRTADAGDATLYVDNFLDPLPARVAFTNPADGATDVPATTDIILTFNRRPLNPATVTSNNIRIQMTHRVDSLGVMQELPRPRSIPGDPLLDQDFDRVLVRYQLTFPLADQAIYRLVAERLEDMVGNDVEYYQGTFSVRDEPPRSSELRFEFDSQERTLYEDTDYSTASWSDAVPDAVAALFTAAGGNGTTGDLTPQAGVNMTVRADDPGLRGVDTMVYDPNPSVVGDEVVQDVFNYRRVNIPQNTVVEFAQRSSGPNRPIVILAVYPIQIDGTITISGRDGELAEPYNTSSPAANNLPARIGGAAGPGGGDGADSYTGNWGPTTYSNQLPAPPLSTGDDAPFKGAEGGIGGGVNTTSYYYYSYSGGGGGGGARQNGTAGTRGASYPGYGGAGGKSEASAGSQPLNNLARVPGRGGGGGGAGGMGYYRGYPMRNTGGSGGGAGGGITLQSAGGVNISSSGRILANGGSGGGWGYTTSYAPGSGGGGGGGSVRIASTGDIVIAAGARIDVSGGKGGFYTPSPTYTYGRGGDGGNGWICIAAPETDKIQVSNGADLSSHSSWLRDLSFSPTGGGEPSVAQTTWINLGVYDPEMLPFDAGADVEQETFGLDYVEYWAQMAIEDDSNLGNPDLSAMDYSDDDGDDLSDDTLDPTELSEWVKLDNLTDLNDMHYQFIRIRVLFYLGDTKKYSDPLSRVYWLVLNFRY